MWKALSDYLKITPKTLAVVVFLLVLADILTRIYWSTLYSEPGKVRLINSEAATLQNQKQQMAKPADIKIVFLGDSQTYGSSVKSSKHTVSAYLEQELERRMPGKDVDVYNFSFKGYGISENYFILNYLADSDINLVVYNLSTGWLTREQVLEHRNVLMLKTDYPDEAEIKKSGITVGKGRRERLAMLIEENLRLAWNFYGTRSALATKILGKPLGQKLDEWKLALANPVKLDRKRQEEAELYLPWYKKDWTQEFSKNKYKVGSLNLSPTNPQIILYNLILDTLEGHEMRALIYTSPQNMAMLRKYNRVDEDKWAEGRQKLKELTASRTDNIYFTDYTYLVDSKYFNDSVHMRSEGNRVTAIRLAGDVVQAMGVQAE